ncbi:MAG: anion permease [Verrucomicrobiota bacterium]|nr:anion permease [Verrucomicrobiota bacterium]
MDFLRKNKNICVFAALCLLGLIIACISPPQGVKPQAWHLFAIFFATIFGIILKPYPMSVISLFGLTAAVATNTLTFADAFSSFSNEVVWLVVFAFFVARGFIMTGLGSRMAYQVMHLLGKSTLGLGYGLVATDLILAPTIPSVTARAGGVIFPILKSLAEIFTGKSHDPRLGAFLTLAAFQGSAITSAMFLTSMAGNPLIAQLAKDHGVVLTWGGWAMASIVPGLLSLIVVPYAMYWFVSPTIRYTPHAKEMAKERLAQMGPMKKDEWIMLGVFILLLVLWIFGPRFELKATVAAMIGLAIMLLTGILKWKDALEETGAWDTFIWFSTLVTLASFLNKLGMTTWFSTWVVSNVTGLNWIVGFLFVALVYFYTHYFFASNVAHIGAMYAPLLIVSIALGAPPELAALTLAFFSNLFGGLTHYGSGPAPILFGAGYVSIGEWWKMGFIASLLNITIWVVIGGLWWKVLGLW